MTGDRSTNSASLDGDLLRADLRRDDVAAPAHPDYEIAEVLGEGGMGTVYRAFDRKLQRSVAMKVLRRDLTGLDERFSREALCTARLEHPNILPLFDRGELADGRPFYTMRLVEGRELGEVIAEHRAKGDDGLRTVVRILATVSEALGHAHAQGFVHRDIKPANVLVGQNGAIWVVDWGVLAQTGSEREEGEREPALVGSDDGTTRPGQVLGTIGYLAPEQARACDEPTVPATDVFAIGCILFEILTGGRPYAGRDVADAIADLGRGDLPPWPPIWRPQLRPLASIARRAMAFEVQRRYANGVELASDLRCWLEGLHVAAHKEGVFERLLRVAARNRELLALVAMYLVVRVSVLLVFSR